LTEKVIQNNTNSKYAINKYQYKAFDDDNQLEPDKPTLHKPKQMDLYEPQQQPQAKQQNEHVAVDESITQNHAETLLKKIDELSTSLIKMEMQMERQQADFNARLEEDKKRAYDDGFNAATTEFDSSYKAKCDDNDKMLSSSIKKLEETASSYEIKMTDIEKELAKTAVSIAEQVIKKEVSENSSKVALSLVRELLTKLKEASKIKLKVNKMDAEYLKNALSAESKVSIEEDDAIQRGGVIVLSDVGNLDGNISSRFLKVKEDLLGDHD
jgi:flagellar assembly protein FliH